MNIGERTMGRLSAILLIAVAFTCSGVEAKALKEVRVRTTEKIKYKGFTYSDKHWIEGMASGLTDKALIIFMSSGERNIRVGVSTITEMQTRGSSFESWEAIEPPFDNSVRVKQALRLNQQSTTTTHASNTPSSNAPFKVAYIEESGVEILILHPDIGSTIDGSQKVRLGLFRQIENFDSAQYIRKADGTYAVRLITFDESGMTHTSEKAVSEAGIRSVQRRFTNGHEAPSVPIQSPTDSTRSPTPRKTSSNEEMYFYLGGAYHFVPNSEFSDDLEIGFGIDLANTNIQGGSLGVIYRTGARTYAEIGIATYGTQDRTVEFGEIIDVSYAVRSIEVSAHRMLIDNFTIFTSIGIASVKDKRKLGTIIDIEDNVTTWPYAMGVRWMPSNMRSGSIRWILDARYRWTSLKYTNSVTNAKSDFELGGLFFQFALTYRR